MRDGQHGDETLRAAAVAMRHSSAMVQPSLNPNPDPKPALLNGLFTFTLPSQAESATYDKGKSDRLVAAAVSAADSFARQFTA